MVFEENNKSIGVFGWVAVLTGLLTVDRVENLYGAGI